MLSQEGLEKFSKDDRNQMFQVLFSQFQDTLYLGGQDYVFLLDGTIRQNRPGKGYPSDADYLPRVNFASMLLLDLSLDKGLEDILNLYQKLRMGQNRGQTAPLKSAIGLLLNKNSIARKWIKNNQLDIATGYEWDTELAQLLLNLPEHVINPRRNLPRWLPGELRQPNFSRLYSTEAVDIFLDYAVIYAQNLPLNGARMDQMYDFISEIRRYPADFVLNPSTQAALIFLREYTHTQGNIKSEASIGKVPVARELLPHPPRILKFRWLNPEVEKLFG